MPRVRTLAVAAGILLLTTGAPAYQSLYGPTELRFWDEERAWAGYTLFSTYAGVFLIDMTGNVVHTWPMGNNPRLLEHNGHILSITSAVPAPGNGFTERDWEGSLVWEHVETRPDYAPHHDMVRIFNKALGAYTTLYIANKAVDHASAVAAGFDPAHGPYLGAEMDAIVEVDMNGQVVWEWWFFDHLVQDISPEAANYVGEGRSIADYPGRLNANLPGRPLSRDWLHCNSLDYNDVLGHVVINSVDGEFYVIDHDGTFIAGDPTTSIALAASPLGDFLYRFGDPARYQQGDPPSILTDWTQATTGHKQIGGSHDIQWIRPGLPGAGNFLLFNNGQYLFERTPQSYIFEIDPYRDSINSGTDHYVNPPDAGYHDSGVPPFSLKRSKKISNQVVWTYSSRSNQGFFSHIGSGCQRLPNGNTLICAMTEGHIFEVTANGELVWEYINPVTVAGAVEVLQDNYPLANQVFRAYRYAAEHPALAGRELIPKGPITEYLNQATPTPTPTATPTPPLGGDVRRDGRVDGLDALEFSLHWQREDGAALPADLDENGVVDAADLLLLIEALMK